MPYGNEFKKNKMVDFWAEAWEQAKNNRRKQNRPAHDLQRSVTMWNNRAGSFAKNRALDPASNMLEILKERAEKEGVFNIAFLQEKLWPKLFQEAWSDLSMDIIFPFNLVYAMGYFPSLRLINAKWVNEESVEKTTGKLRDWLAGYTDITPAVLESLHEFVVNESVNGLVKEEVETNIGMMVWQV